MNTVEHETDFGRDMQESLREVWDHLDGKIALLSREIAPMTAARVKAIRKSVAKGTQAFERRSAFPPEPYRDGSKAAVST